MKILICPDSFKGSASSKEVIERMNKAVEDVFPSAKVVSLLMADGGEGTMEAITQGKFSVSQPVTVTTPYGEDLQVEYWVTEDRVAIFEMAAASGITLSREKDPLKASSIGFGQLIDDAAKIGVKRMIIGIGGSATNDGGMGMLEGLGVVFLDEENQPLRGSGENMAKIKTVDLSGIPPHLRSIPIDVICDVTNPLLGEEGATAIYGPQKGVTPEIYLQLENGMANFAEKIALAVGKDCRLQPGAGAAGGVGFALSSVLQATLVKGIDLVLSSVGFDRHLLDTDLIITGEGCIDHQSVLFGKVPSGITQRAKGIPVLVVVGGIGEGGEGIMKQGNASIITTVNKPMTLDEACEDALDLIYGATKRGLEMIRLGMIIGNKG